MTSITEERRKLAAVKGGPRLRRRNEWNARRSYTDSRAVSDRPAIRGFVHITVTNPGNYSSNDAHARAIEAIGISRFPNTGISYNRLVMPNGALYEAQPVGRRGAHTVNDKRLSNCQLRGHSGVGSSVTAPSYNLNVNSLAYVLCQNVGDTVSDKQIDNLAKAIVADVKAGFLTERAARNMHGHRCVAWKSCPGDKMWARMDDLYKKIVHYLNNGLEEDVPNSQNSLYKGVMRNDNFMRAPKGRGGNYWWAESVIEFIADTAQQIRKKRTKPYEPDGNKINIFSAIMWSHSRIKKMEGILNGLVKSTASLAANQAAMLEALKQLQTGGVDIEGIKNAATEGASEAVANLNASVLLELSADDEELEEEEEFTPQTEDTESDTESETETEPTL